MNTLILLCKYILLQKLTKHIYSMTQDDALKIKAVILYVSTKVEGVTTFYLSKILYFANEKHLAKYGRPIVKDVFHAFTNGPVPSFVYDAIKVAQRRNGGSSMLNIIANSISTGDKSSKDHIFPKEKPDLDELSKSDIECLNASIEENKDLKFSDLSSKSHDIAWKEAWNKKNASPIDILLMAKAGGANDATIDYIKENLLIDNL